MKGTGLVGRLLLVGGLTAMFAWSLSAQSPEHKKFAEDKKKYDECVNRVKKEHPAPPGNVEEQKQLIQDQCGNPPTRPKE